MAQNNLQNYLKLVHKTSKKKFQNLKIVQKIAQKFQKLRKNSKKNLLKNSPKIAQISPQNSVKAIKICLKIIENNYKGQPWAYPC